MSDSGDGRLRTASPTSTVEFTRSIIQFDRHGAMIGAFDLGLDPRFLEAFTKLLGEAEVIDTPPDVPLADAGAIAPPGVMARSFLEFTEGVHVTEREGFIEAVALLDREASIAQIALGVLQVDLLMRDIEIATEDDRLGLFQLLQVRAERGVPDFRAEIQTDEFALGIGGVNADEGEILELGIHNAAFVIDLLLTDAVSHIERFFLREDSGAGVALLLGGVPELVITAGPEHIGNLIFLRLGFLEAEHVRLGIAHEIQQALAQGRAHTIDVPGNEFHAGKNAKKRGGKEAEF